MKEFVFIEYSRCGLDCVNRFEAEDMDAAEAHVRKYFRACGDTAEANLYEIAGKRSLIDSTISQRSGVS